MKITVVGTGYVGLVQGVILAEFGMDVICLDSDLAKIAQLNQGILPIYEPGLKEVMDKNILAGRLRFTSDATLAYRHGAVIFIAVGTPAQDDGSADLSSVLAVAHAIGASIDEYKVIVNKSTVPVGTGKLVRQTLQERLEQRQVAVAFDIVSNPEFLREGKALSDCLRPDRVVIGCESETARIIMQNVYNVLYINQTPFVFTNLETAEMIKYAANSFLAVKISFINEIALLAEKVGANTQEIAKAMGMDGRISPKFLHCGPGYGGSCFPKDTQALVTIAADYNEEMLVVKAAIAANEKQKLRMIAKIITTLGHVRGKTIGVLGLSFKPDTDDLRDAPALAILRGLVGAGALIRAFCPEGIKEARWRLSDIEKSLTYCANEYAVAHQADALVIITEWNQFRGLDLNELKKAMAGDFFFDLRNIFTKSAEVRALFKYFPVGQQ